MNERLEDHGVIGDMRTVALVGLSGSIDFMCWPRFDSPTIFAALLDADSGGSFDLSPTFKESRRRQNFVSETNVLMTRFSSDEGIAELTDFMTVDEPRQRLFRRIKAARRAITVKLQCRPAFDYVTEAAAARQLMFLTAASGATNDRQFAASSASEGLCG